MMANKRWVLLLLIFTIMLAGCGSPTPSITPVITAPSATNAPSFRPSGRNISASGVVEPSSYANLGLVIPARIKSVEVTEGEDVKEGQILVQLVGHEQMEAAVAAAEYNLLSAQMTAEMALAQAKLDLANAMDALDEAEREWSSNQLGNRATASSLKDAKADVTIAEKRLSQARINLDKASGTSAKAQAQSALREAEKAYYQAVWLLDWLQSEPTELEQALLDANLEMARARLNNAEQELTRLGDSSGPDAAGMAELSLKAAELQVAAARAALADSEIQAPFAGTVTSVMVNPGEAVVPGQVLLTVADLDHFQVTTTDLSERDVAVVKVGQQVKVDIEALGQKVDGEVTKISQQATTIGGDVVYAVTIDLKTHPPELRWGMNVEVEISTD